MANLAELALQSAALKALADAVAVERKTVQAAMQSELETTGAARVDASLPDGSAVASVSRTQPKLTARVVDDEAFLAWVRDTAPSEVTSRVVTEVRPAFQAALLAQMTAAGATEVPDKVTGEVTDVPGVEVTAGRAMTHSVRLSKDGAALIADAWRAGHLAHLDLPRLMQGNPA